MDRLFGWILAGGIVLGSAASADAQIAISVGNPYAGLWGTSSYYGASPWYSGYSSVPMVGTTTYSSGYAGFAAPSATYLSSGYYGAYPAAPLYPSGYGVGTYAWPSVVTPYYGGYGRWGWGRGGLLGVRGWRW